MNIILEDRNDIFDGGKLVAYDGDIIAGYIRWYDRQETDKIVRVFDKLFVKEEYRGEHLGGELTAAAKAQREADGVIEWISVPMTSAGRHAIDGHIERNYGGVDPRRLNNG